MSKLAHVLPSLEVTTAAASADVDIVGVFQEGSKTNEKKAVLPKGVYSSVADRLRKKKALSGGLRSMSFVRFGGKRKAESVLFAGLGVAAQIDEEKLRRVGAALWSRLTAERVKIATVAVDSFSDVAGFPDQLTPLRCMRALAEGMVLSAYRIEKVTNKKADESHAPEKIIFLVDGKDLEKSLKDALTATLLTARAVHLTRDWSNLPSNIGTPKYYAAEATRLAKQSGLRIQVLGPRELKKEKMGLFLGVSQGALEEPRLVRIEYSPKGIKKPKTVALVGKGVTFDSGGISLKPGLRMEDMKHDMTGAATVMGAVMLAAWLKLPQRVVGVMAFCENMPDAHAIQPGNVLTARSGKTVEILNTDAEGRLILGDALDYAQDLKPNVVIDVATLTGACSVAVGKHCCVIMGNDQELVDELRAAGDQVSERMWQLPAWDEYAEEMRGSEYADLRNTVNNSNGGTIRGGVFLQEFIRSGTKWAHLDIASTAWDMGHVPYFPRVGACGIFVRALAKYISNL